MLAQLREGVIMAFMRGRSDSRGAPRGDARLWRCAAARGQEGDDNGRVSKSTAQGFKLVGVLECTAELVIVRPSSVGNGHLA